jgi:competence protein ComEC
VILFHAGAAFLAGVALAALGGAWAWPIVMLGGAGLVCGSFLTGKRREAALLALLLFLGLAGIDRYEEALPSAEPEGIALLNGGDVDARLRGIIVDEPVQGEVTQRFTLQVESADAGDGAQPADGRVRVSARPFPRYKYGDTLELTGTLETPPLLDDFDYARYLALRGIGSQILYPRQVEVVASGGGSAVTRLLIEARGTLGEALERSLPEPESALARGILLGQHSMR